MRHSTRYFSALALAALTLAVAGVLHAQVKQGKTRPAKTGHLMKGIVKPNCDALKKGLEAAPADDKTWASLAVNAGVLNESSYTLMDDGRCPDAVWADATTKMLRAGSADLIKAIEAKDHAAAKAAFGSLTKSCKTCHDAHKKKE